MRKRTFLVFMLVLAFSSKSFSQGFVNPDIVPKVSSPEAAELGKHISVPVSLNTGTPNISIPLYTITYGGMQVPITLNYDASGVKVDELASNVGLKWSLDYGGAVTRIVRGGRDEGTNGGGFPGLRGYYKDYGLTTLSSTFQGVTGQAAGMLYTDLMTGLSMGWNDGQPDLFSFNAMGYTGRFFFDQNRNSIAFTESDYSIDLIYNGALSSPKFEEFRIKTSNGLEMFFGSTGAIEKNFTDSGWQIGDQGMTDNAWMLKKVLNLSNNRYIEYNYTAEWFNDVIVSNREPAYITQTTSGIGVISHHQDPIDCMTELPGVPPPLDLPPLTTWHGGSHLNYSYSQVLTQRISSIVAGKTTVEFIASPRQDIYLITGGVNKVQKIDQIIVKYDGVCVKKFRLNYGYFNAVGEIDGAIDQTFEDSAKKRLKLVSLEEMDCNDNVVKKHEFFYDETNPLPVRYSYAKDKWGFYNGKINNKSLYPKLSPDCASYWWTADRSISPAHTKAGTLTKIIYPTKGSVSFGYENHVSDVVVTPSDQIGWITQSDINTYTSLSSTVEYTFTPSTPNYEIDILLHSGVPWYHPSPNPCLGTSFNYQKGVELVDNTTGNVVYERLFGALVVNNILTDTYTHSQEFTNLSTAKSYTLRVYSMSDSNGSKCFTAQAKLSKLGNLPPTTQDFLVGGLRIKNVIFKDDKGTILLTNSYTYEQPKLVDNPQFIYKGNYDIDLTLNGIRSLEDYPSYLLETNMNFKSGIFDVITTGANIRQMDFLGSHISYQKVTEKNSEGKNLYYYYPAKTYFEANGYRATDFYPKIPVFQSSLAGRLMRQETYDANNQLLRESYNGYEIHLVDNGIEALVATKLPVDNILITPVEFYNVKPEYSVLKNTITTDYFQGAPVQTSTEYFYQSAFHHQPTLIVTTDSKGEEQKTQNQYPPDVPTKPHMAELIQQNRISTPVVSKSLQGTTLLSQQEIVFSKNTSTSNLTLPTEALIAKGDSNSESRVKYEKYDGQGNILQFRITDGTPTSFLWGYDNQFPVARVDNATYDQILSSGVVLATINNLATTDASMRTELQKIRNALPNAQVTSYTYDPLVGVTSITDPKGYITYYNYDSFNRLAYISDQDGKVVQEYRYHYALPEIISTLTASSYNVNSGTTVAFTTNATGGTGNFSYKWTVSNANLNQTTTTGTNTFSVATTSAHAPSFTLTCEVTDTQTGDKTSTSTQVTVNSFAPLGANTTASSTSVNSGATVSFTTTPSGGSGNFSYKWTVSNATLNQVTTTTTGSFSVTTSASHTPSFTLNCEVTDLTTGQKVTTTKTVSVNNSPPPLSVAGILISPSGSKSVFQAVNFSVVASGGSGNYSYQWSRTRTTGNVTHNLSFTTPNITYFISSQDCNSFIIKCVITDLVTGSSVTKTTFVSVFNGCGF